LEAPDHRFNGVEVNVKFYPQFHKIFLGMSPEREISTRSLRASMKERKMNEEKLYCSVCGKEISTEEYE